MAAYTVTLNKNGGPANGTNSVSATYGSAMPSATMPTRLGYTFAGYYDTSAASGGTQYYTAAGASARTWNKQAAATLYARWTKNSYNLTLNMENQYQVLPYSGKIEDWDNSIVSNLSLLAQHKDGYFASGVNGVTSYVNNSSSGNGTSTVTRVSKQSDNPLTGSNYELKVSVSKNANTAYIGFVQTTTSAASQVFVHLFVAKLPKNYYFSYASNATGDGRSFKWLTPWEGTGKYEIYAIELQCGSSGTFSTFGHIYVQPNNTAFTLDFYVAYSEIFRTTRNQTISIPYGTRITNLPIPAGHGTKLKSWCTNYTGSGMKTYGRDYMYTDKISIHLTAYMADWSQYVTGNSSNNNMAMRLISCTEGGGFNIEPSSGNISAAGYDSGVGYKSATSTVAFSSLSAGWHMFDIIFNGTNLKLYLDGELIATSANYTSGKIGYNAANGIFVAGEAEGNETTASSYRFVGQVGNVIIQHTDTLISEEDGFHQMVMPAAATTITPWWSGSNNFKIHLDDTNTDFIGSTEITDTYMSVVNIPTPLKFGYKFRGWGYKFDGFNYLSFGRGFKWTDKFSLHFEAYMDDWSQYQNNMSTLSCTEGGGWSFWFNEYVYAEMYDSGASAYKSITSNVRYADLTGWNSFDLVYNGINFKLYLNDELLGTSATMSGPISYNSRNSITMGVEPGGYTDNYGGSPTAHSGNKFIGKIANFRMEHIDEKISDLDINTIQIPAQETVAYPLWEKLYPKVYTNNGWENHVLKVPKPPITDLTNTLWTFKDNINLSHFGGTKEWAVNIMTGNNDGIFGLHDGLVRLTIDENNSNFILRYRNASSTISYDVYDTNGWINNRYKLINIRGGNDVTNSELIEFLTTYATQYKPEIITLVNTEWYFNATLVECATGWWISGSMDVDGEFESILFEDGTLEDITGGSAWYTNGAWVNDSYRHIRIYGESPDDQSDDVSFIYWLFLNATLLTPHESKNVSLPIKVYTENGWKVTSV